MDPIYKAMIGDRIREARKYQGLTQEELAKKAGISMMSVRRYETHERVPNKATLKKIADALEIDYTALFFSSFERDFDLIRKSEKEPLSQRELEYVSQFNPTDKEGLDREDFILQETEKKLRQNIAPPSVHALSALGISPEIALLVYSLTKLSKKDLAKVMEDISRRLEEEERSEDLAEKNNP